MRKLFSIEQKNNCQQYLLMRFVLRFFVKSNISNHQFDIKISKINHFLGVLKNIHRNTKNCRKNQNFTYKKYRNWIKIHSYFDLLAKIHATIKRTTVATEFNDIKSGFDLSIGMKMDPQATPKVTCDKATKAWLQNLLSLSVNIFFIILSYLFLFPLSTPAQAGELTNQFSLSIWVNPQTSIATKALVVKDTEVRLVTDGSGNPLCQIYASAAWQTAATSSTALTTGTWSHVTCTYDKANIKVFVNGVQTGSVAQTNAVNDGATSLLVGQDDTATYGNFIGTTDQLQIYNYARTRGQIIEDLNAGHPAPGSPVGSAVGTWHFDEGADNTCSGGSNDVCNAGTGGTGLDGTLTATSRTLSGKFRSAFDGGDNKRATVSDNAGLDFANGTDDFTLSLWFNRAASIANDEYLLDKHATNDGYTLYMDSDGDIVCGIGDGAAAWIEEKIGDTLSKNYDDGAWHYGACVKSGTSSLRLYVDGKEIASDTSLAVDADMSNASALYIGDANATDGTDEFLGDIDEVKIYRSALTAEQVKADMNRGQSQILGALGDNTTYEKNAANQEYCVPGDATSCTAPVGRWDFEEGTGTAANDTSGGGNSGSITGATYTTGKKSVGAALNFNAGTDAVTVSNTLSTKTVEFWVYPTTTTENLIDLRTAATAASISVSSGTISATGFTSPTIYVNGRVSSTLAANLWHHVAITTGTAISASAIRFGRISATSLTGKLDDIRIYDYVRSAAQIAWDYNQGKPIGHWRMDECQGTVANDSSGNSNTGTITIGATGTQASAGTCSTSSTAWGNGISGKRNYSLNFDGTDDYVNAGQVLPTAVTTPFTFTAWVNPAAGGASTWRTIIGTDTSFAEIAISSENQFNCGQNAGGGFFQPATFTITNGSWYHFTCVYDGTNLSTYVNGVKYTGPTARTFTNASHGVTVMGRYQTAGGEWFNGQIDDARVYNYALTAVQVKTLFNGGAVGFQPTTGAP